MEGEAIKRKDLLKEEDNAATKKRDLERQGKTHNENA